MDDTQQGAAGRVLERLERIDTLQRDGTDRSVLLDELRGLVHDAERWARAEGDERADAAADRLGEAVARAGEVVDARILVAL